MNILQMRLSNQIYGNTSFYAFSEHVETALYYIRNDYYVFHTLNGAAIIACGDFMTLMNKLRARGDFDFETINELDPSKDWALFTTKEDGPSGEIYTTEQRNVLSRQELILEINRDLLRSFVDAFETFEALTLPDDVDSSHFVEILNDHIRPCLDHYKAIRSAYETHLSKRIFALMRERSYGKVHSKVVAGRIPEVVEFTSTMASNPLRRALEFVAI